jgi:hypothetical protein
MESFTPKANKLLKANGTRKYGITADNVTKVVLPNLRFHNAGGATKKALEAIKVSLSLPSDTQTT